MEAYLDKKKLKTTVKKIEIVSALERFKDPDLMRGEQISAALELPDSLSEFQKLVIYAEMPDKNRSGFLFLPENLRKRETGRRFILKRKKCSRAWYV